MFHFYNALLNLFNISSLSSSGRNISSTNSCFSILSSFDLVAASGILFPKNSPALRTTFLKADFKESGSVSNNYFLANDNNQYPLTYFPFLSSIEYCCIAELKVRVISIY